MRGYGEERRWLSGGEKLTGWPGEMTWRRTRSISVSGESARPFLRLFIARGGVLGLFSAAPGGDPAVFYNLVGSGYGQCPWWNILGDAGSCITKDVPPGALAVARAHQVIKDGWVATRRSRKQAQDPATSNKKS